MLRFLKRTLHRVEDDDLREELAAHLAIERAEQAAEGKSEDAASRAAHLAFGNTTRTREEIRDQWSWTAVERFLQDVQFGWRLLWRTPVWTAVVGLTLAIGVAIGTAVFSVVYGMLLIPLPYPQPDQIVTLQPVSPKPAQERFNASPALWTYWRKHVATLSEVALTRHVVNFNLSGQGSPERLRAARTTFNLTAVLGLRPQLGRMFTEQEQLTDEKVVVLSHGLWTRRFGEDPSIVGRRIQLNGDAYEVIGVLPSQWSYPEAGFEVFAPLSLQPGDLSHGFNYGMLCTGRIRDGETIEHVQSELNVAMAKLAADYPAAYRSANDRMSAVAMRLAENQTASIRPTLLMLGAAVACLLTIGCLNLAVLLIARAGARSREMLLRISLGASNARLRRQLIAESAPLAVLGAVGGILLGRVLIAWLITMLPAGSPRVESVGMNAAVIVFAMSCSLAVVLAASLLPARLSSVGQLSPSLNEGSRSVAQGVGVRNVLVTAQVAMALLLLFGALLFGRSLMTVLAVQPGFTDEGVLTMHVAVSRAKYREDAQVADYFSRLEERIRTIPGVADAGFVNRLPLSGLAQTGGVEFEGRGNLSLADTPFMADWRSATPGYFRAIGIPLVRGRFLERSDRSDTLRVGLIDTQMAKQMFGSEDPIGKRFRRSAGAGLANDEPWSVIVGVVGHIRNDSLEADLRPQVYWPETQRTQDRGALVVRTSGDPASYAAAITREIQLENPDQPVYDVRTMRGWVTRSVQTRVLTTGVVSVFGLASVLLACLGLYGTMSYSTGLRRREFGIRLALGSPGAAVLGLVLRQAGVVVGAGLFAGLVLCWASARVLDSFLYGIEALDLSVWLWAPMLMIFVSFVAALGPALRAARIDPVQTLRAE